MNVKSFLDITDTNFYTGVPDSQLKALCNYLMHTHGINNKHIIAANEGNAVAIAAGYHLATGKVPLVYLQNSGLGNIINPVASLLNHNVYGIPCIFVVGWRGEPGVHDEPQHIFQGEITLKLLEDMNIAYSVLDKSTTESDLRQQMIQFSKLLSEGKQIAFVVRKDALTFTEKVAYKNNNTMLREEIINRIVSTAKDDIIISTTGKASRELFEIREATNHPHNNDFLTVGSMGHSSSIALGIALNKPDKKIWIIDGDGATLMHLGAMALIGSTAPKNIIHIVINNGAHESVGGLPTVAEKIDLTKIAVACGYNNTYCVSNESALNNALCQAQNNNTLSFIEARAAIGARENLGRPTTTAKENKNKFMQYLQN